MKRLTTLTGKNLPRLAVAKPGWPETPQHPFNADWDKVVADFTRICDQAGLIPKRGNNDTSR